MQYLIPVASGKGGVGKTIVVANLGIALAQAGKTVVLVDLDLGASNLHTVLGIRNNAPGIGNYVLKQVEDINSLIVPTQFDKLHFILGDALYSGIANLPYFRKRAILKGLPEITADIVLLDLGAGTAFNTLDFFLSSRAGLLVTTPETTAILNAYSFLKAAMFRVLHHRFRAKSPERGALSEFSQERLEGHDLSLADLLSRLGERVGPDSERIARETMEEFRPRIVMNHGRAGTDIHAGRRLRAVAKKNLDSDVEFIGYLPYDETVLRAPIERAPTIVNYPDCRFSLGIKKLARRLKSEPVPAAPKIFPEDEDLAELEEEFEEQEAR